MTSKKILFLSITLKKGGAENQLMQLAVFLKKQGFEINILYFVDGNDFINTLSEYNIVYHRIPIKTLSGLKSYKKQLNIYNPDLIISFMFGANVIGRITKLFFKIPLITSVRNNEISKFYSFLYKLTYKLDTQTTFNSKYALEKFVKNRLTVASKSSLMNNAIIIKENNRIDPNNDVFTMVSIAHFRPQKDYKTFFKAVAYLKNNNQKIKVYILGHLYDQEWPRFMIKELGIQEEIILVGFTNETSKFLNMADTLVLSSLWEGTPNAILEGMSHKLPIIASSIPGSKDLVKDASCGYLFEPGNYEELASSIIKMKETALSERKEFGENGYQFVRDNYESSTVHKEWFKLIEFALNND